MIRTNNRVALYARFSSDNQRTESIDAQIRAMTAYCKQHNFIIIETYIDEAKSATSDKRESFQRMIADSQDRRFDIVLVHKLDRFARNRYDSAVYKRELRKNGVSVYSVLENLDDRPESIMLESILEGMAEYYSKNLGREVMKGMKETAMQCKHTGGTPPLGYDVDPITKKLILNPEEAETVKLIFGMYSLGYGYGAILDELHRQNRKTKRGDDFRKNSLHSILTNPKYKGVYVYNRSSSKTVFGTRNTHLLKDREEMIIIEGGCPQIVDEETFERVQTRIRERQHTGGRDCGKVNYLLTSRIFCAECGRAMVGNCRASGRSKKIHITYRCPTKRYCCTNKEINRDYIEHYIIRLLEKHILNPKALVRIAEHIRGWAQQKAANADFVKEELQAELEAVNAALQNVADAVAAGLMSNALITRLNELEQQKADVEGRLAEEQREFGELLIDPQGLLADYAEFKKAKSSPMYKEFIRGLIDRIDVGKYSVNITLRTGLGITPVLDTTFTVKRQVIYEQKKWS